MDPLDSAFDANGNTLVVGDCVSFPSEELKFFISHIGQSLTTGQVYVGWQVASLYSSKTHINWRLATDGVKVEIPAAKTEAEEPECLCPVQVIGSGHHVPGCTWLEWWAVRKVSP